MAGEEMEERLREEARRQRRREKKRRDRWVKGEKRVKVM